MAPLRERLLAIRLETLGQELLRLFRGLDPSPRSAPLSGPFLACFAAAVGLTIWSLVANKYLPGQDISYHAHCSRVWLDAGHPGSPYELYESAHPLEANTLMYSVAGLFSHLGSSFSAFRFVQGYYLIGLPIACLYALRALDRAPWGSLLAFPLCYTEIFAAGYANMAFAAPSFIFALVAYRRFAQAPSVRRGLVVMILFVIVFLSHAHVYLWLGGLVLLYSLAVLGQKIREALTQDRWRAARTLLDSVLGAAVVAAPSLALFARWYARGYGSGHSVGSGGNNVAFASSMEWTPLPQKFMAGALQAFQATANKYEVVYMLGLALLVVFAMALARAGRDRTAPLPEIALLVTIVSFFVLPDGVALQMVAVRQWYFVFWLVPLVVVPVPLRFGEVRAIAVIGGILVWTVARLSLVTDYLRRFTNEEMIGLDSVVAAAPRVPGLLVAYAATNARSKYWLTSSMYHAYGFLDAQRSYDGPLEYSDARSVAAVRYKEGPPRPVKHLYGNPMWPADPAIWQYDLVLVYRWSPTPFQEKAALEHGNRIAASGEWQLWERRRP
jgi:hypothetical protein